MVHTQVLSLQSLEGETWLPSDVGAVVSDWAVWTLPFYLHRSEPGWYSSLQVLGQGLGTGLSLVPTHACQLVGKIDS